jgi:bifunctional ADP-heptose synthase (sugar kinase/adenylyltransferase)
LLIGEQCRDEYHYGTVDRISPEAPVPVFDYERTEVRPGMAGNVYHNLKAFGCSVDFITNDEHKIIKRRFVDSRLSQQLLREDIGNEVDPVSLDDLPDLNQYDAIVFSDYCKGLLTWGCARSVCTKANCKIFVDSKGSDLTCFPNSVIKINQKEYDQGPCFAEPYELIVTKAKNGAEWNRTEYPAPPVNVYDVSGAGDVFHATLAVISTVTDDLSMGIKCAVKLATKSVGHVGTYCITKEDIMEVLSESFELCQA